MATQSIYPTTKDDPPVEYPTGDGQPMAEMPVHRDNMIAMLDVLRSALRDRPDGLHLGELVSFLCSRQDTKTCLTRRLSRSWSSQ